VGFSGMALAVYAFLIIIIFFYDRHVEKNYQTIYKRAKQVGAIVLPIFPGVVQQRLYPDEERLRNSQGGNNSTGGTGPDGIPNAVNATKNCIKGVLNKPGVDPMVRKQNGLSMESTVDDMEGSI
jgi:hypothetical protein